MIQEPYEIHWKDYYKILELNIDSNEEEIKKNYRRLAKNYHPDNNPNNLEAEAKFKEINEAFMILGNNDKRKKYDYFYKSISKKQQNTRFNPYEKLDRIFILTMQLGILKDQLLKHKIKQVIGAGLTVSGVTGLLLQIINNLDAIQNEEGISNISSILAFIYGALISSGVYTLYKESKFDTQEHLQKISRLEDELIRTLKI